MRVDPTIKPKDKAEKENVVNVFTRKIAIAMVFLVIYFFFIKLLFL